jgi:hypothetical protein
MKTRTIHPRYRLVEVAPRTQIYRHHRAWLGGEKVRVKPRDAEALLSRGMVREIEP